MNILVSFVQWNPLVSILFFSLLITFSLSFLYKKLTDQKEFERLKQRQKELQQEMKDCKDANKMADIQKELLQSSMGSMKLTFKPMMITILPLMLIIWGLQKLYLSISTINGGNIIYWHKVLPIIGDGGGWFFCYVISSLIFSMIIRKVFKMG